MASSRSRSSRGGRSRCGPRRTLTSSSPSRPGRSPRPASVGEPIVLDGVLPDVDDPDGVTINEDGDRVLRRRGRRHADVRHGVAGAPRRVGDTTTASSTPATPSTGRRSTSRSPPSPGPTATSSRRSRSSTFPRGSPAPTPTTSPTSRRSSTSASTRTVSTPIADRGRGGPGDRTASTSTPLEGVGAAIVPSIDVGVSTLWIATAVAALRRSPARRPGAGPARRRVGGRPPALDAMGVTRPQRTSAIGGGGDASASPPARSLYHWSPGR